MFSFIFKNGVPFLFLLVLVLILVIAFLRDIEGKEKESVGKITQVCFDDTCFRVEVADTVIKRSKGLMYRKKMSSGKGMLFIFNSNGKQSFWMKNTLISLDIIWIDENKEIVYMKENAQPCKKVFCSFIRPDTDARYVLEVNAGQIKIIGLKVGDKAVFSGDAK